MALRRFWAQEAEVLSPQQLRISGELFHHIVHVCRFQFQEPFELLGLEQGVAWQVTLQQKGKKEALVTVVGKRKLPSLPKPFIHLVLSVPKPQTLESVCEKCVELGVYAVYLASSEYSFLKDAHRINYARLDKIINHALGQTGRWEKMQLRELRPLSEWISLLQTQYPKSIWIWADETYSSQKSLKATFTELKNSQDLTENIFLIIGSEGGFSPKEVSTLAQQGLTRVSLGQQVLRVETACVHLISSVKYEWELP